MSSNFGGQPGQEIDLNITPVIDCFTVLITFLLASASFLSIGFFDVNTPGPSLQETQKDPEIEVILKVKSNQTLTLSWKGKRTGTKNFILQEGQKSEELVNTLKNLKNEGGEFSQVLFTAEDAVPYGSIALIMDQIQATEIPMMMGDFQ